MSRWDLPADMTFDRLLDMWLEDVSSELDSETLVLYRLHMRTHLVPHFESPLAISQAMIAAYGRKRLKVVKRTTLLKERSTLRRFLAWCAEQGYLLETPDFPVLPRRATGTAWHQRRRGAATELTPEECRKLIAALPQWSRSQGGRPKFPIRARFVVMHETSLRPATLDALSVPEHYSKGSDALRITDAIDKARFGRDLPLNTRAREALDSVAPASGTIFGSHDYRYHLDLAAKRALTEPKARTFTAYDLRHARLTELAEKGNLPGVAYLAGHRLLTTTNIYVRPGLRAAKRALDSAGERPASSGRGLAGLRQLHDLIPVRAKERTRTSTGVTPLAPQATVADRHAPLTDLDAAAVALLRAAAEGLPVEHEGLSGFALLSIASTERGRLELEILQGGEHAPRRALELARLIVADAALADDERGAL
jgi:integrase